MRLIVSISCGFEEVEAFFVGEEIADLADGLVRVKTNNHATRQKGIPNPIRRKPLKKNPNVNRSLRAVT